MSNKFETYTTFINNVYKRDIKFPKWGLFFFMIIDKARYVLAPDQL